MLVYKPKNLLYRCDSDGTICKTDIDKDINRIEYHCMRCGRVYFGGYLME